MKAVVCTRHGPPDVLEIQEVQTPTPADDEVLIKVHATSVTTGDVNARGFLFVPPGLGFLARLMLGFRKAKHPVLGSDLAGEIAAVGREVQSFAVGDQVYGIDGDKLGAYAEFVCRAEAGPLTKKPANMSYEEAAAIPFGALTALYFLQDKGELAAGQTLLVNGASGSVGTAAIQLGKHFGAEVTGVCSTANLELVKSLGADHVIDYTKEDFARSSNMYDLIFDTVVGQTSYSRCKGSLNPNGRYLAVAGGLREMIQMVLTSIGGGKKVIFGGGEVCERKESLQFIKELAEEGKIRAVIDRTYPLDQMVEAHRYVDAGHKKGNVAITVAPSA